MHRIEVYLKSHLTDARGERLLRDIRDLGINSVSSVRVVDIYWLDTKLKSEELEFICRQLLADPVTHDYRYEYKNRAEPDDGVCSVEVTYNAGVTDPVEGTIVKAVGDLGIGVKSVKTGKRYLIRGQIGGNELQVITSRLLVNPIVQHVVQDTVMIFPERPQYNLEIQQIELLAADGKSLSNFAQRFGFTYDEMKAIAAYFRRVGRSPTDIELETLAQTWSEHCVHKTFKAKIKFGDHVINNLLKNTIMRATTELNKPWCLSVFEDNAGVIDFDGQWAVCFKVETHNHPSAIEPYGGAATGLGGVVRDVLGTGLSAKPIFNTDVFCFAPPDFPYDDLPPGVLHPRTVLKGVRAGVADYGNRLGIPTLNGTVRFDKRYLANPMVFCGTAGIMPKECALIGRQEPGDVLILIGGRTGSDGIHGVNFASEKLTEESSETSYSAVQIGNPIIEKKIIDALIKARDRRLFSRITDCGGGGLSSAVGEMAADTGVVVYLDRVPLKYSGLSYDEIWISESQERMVLAVPKRCLDEILSLFDSENVEAAAIGEFTDDRRLKLFYQDSLVGDLDMNFLHQGRPQLELEASWQPVRHSEPIFKIQPDLGESLLSLLSSLNVCSKEWIIRQYDHEVQGSSLLKPLVGRNNDGPGDAAIIKPLLDSRMGIIVANGINPNYGDIDPYWMAASAIDEALRQIIAVGGNLERVALLDNFCWGDVSDTESLGALVRTCQACYDMSVAYGTPFISGKDSLNNELQIGGKLVSIPHTLLISSLAVMSDTGRAVSMDFKQDGDLVYLVGRTYIELGGSEYFMNNRLAGNIVPIVRPQQARELMNSLSQSTEKGLVRACHDLSEGGLGVAIAEMAFAGQLGAVVRLNEVPLDQPVDRDDFVLFSESNSRFLAEVAPENRSKFEEIMASTSFALIVKVTASDRLEIYGLDGKKVGDKSIGELKEAWQRPLRW